MSPYEWRAELIDDFMRNRQRLVVYRYVGDDVEIVNGDGTLSRYPADESVDSVGIALPRGAWEAIEAVVLPKAKDGEIALLKDALAVERARVDQVLERRVQP